MSSGTDLKHVAPVGTEVGQKKPESTGINVNYTNVNSDDKGKLHASSVVSGIDPALYEPGDDKKAHLKHQNQAPDCECCSRIGLLIGEKGIIDTVDNHTDDGMSNDGRKGPVLQTVECLATGGLAPLMLPNIGYGSERCDGGEQISNQQRGNTNS